MDMAKDKYTVSTAVDLVGFLDVDQDEKLIVQVEHGKGDNMVVVAVDLLDVLTNCVGRQISLKLTDEEDKVNA